MASNESHWTSRTKPPKVAGIHELDADTTLATKVDALTWKLDLLMGSYSDSSSGAVLFCETRGGGMVLHSVQFLVFLPFQWIMLNVSGGQQGPGSLYNNTYNMG